MSAKHTPGPWKVGGDDGGWSAEYDGDTDTYASQPVVADTGDTVCLVVCVGWDEREFDANARLIAAAPELLAALKLLMEQPTMNPLSMSPEQRASLWAAHEAARAALSKAEPT